MYQYQDEEIRIIGLNMKPEGGDDIILQRQLQEDEPTVVMYIAAIKDKGVTVIFSNSKLKHFNNPQ